MSRSLAILGKVTPATPQELWAALPEENIWLANFTSPQTRAAYKDAVSDFIGFHGVQSSQELYNLTRAHVIAWRDAMMANGASPRTIATRLSAVSSLYAHLCEQQLAPLNPTTGVKRPKVASQTVETPALSREQVRAMLDAPDLETLQGLRDRALLSVYFYTGCRVSEPCRLRVKDLHQDQAYWVLDFTIKGGHRHRVAINPACVEDLQTYIGAMSVEREDSYGPDAWLFQAMFNGTNGPMTRDAFYKLFKRYAQMAGLPASVTPHSARATLVTEALEREHPVEAVQKTVGHASVTTTLAYDKRRQKMKDSASLAVRY
ncbi:MAG: tyrosine-type recombinase/integrase [Hyphomicrobiales bacterium]